MKRLSLKIEFNSLNEVNDLHDWAVEQKKTDNGNNRLTMLLPDSTLSQVIEETREILEFSDVLRSEMTREAELIFQKAKENYTTEIQDHIKAFPKKTFHRGRPKKNKFECSTCGKTFPTGQGLSSHKRAHERLKTTTTTHENSNV